MYADAVWNTAENLFSDGESAFGRMEFASAIDAFHGAIEGFLQSVRTAEVERKRREHAEAECQKRAEAERKAREEERKRREHEEVGRKVRLERERACHERKADVKILTLPGGEEMCFRWCPPGTFMMGSPVSENGRNPDERQHRVSLTSGFWIGSCPVTKRQWKSVMGGVFSVKCSTGEYRFADEENPAEAVSWNDCRKFLRKISNMTGLKFSLPTEAQWEYACRAGTSTPFSFGTALNGDKANCNGRYPYGCHMKGPYCAATTAVRTYPANPWGIWDMHGNVGEWCNDWYGPYGEEAQDPLGAISGELKVIRGGGWVRHAKDCRSASRWCVAPDKRIGAVGFRPVCVFWGKE